MVILVKCNCDKEVTLWTGGLFLRWELVFLFQKAPKLSMQKAKQSILLLLNCIHYFVVVLFVVFFVIMYFIMRGKDDKEKNPNFCECYKMQKELDKNFDSNKATEWEQKCNKGAMNLSPKEFDKAMSECN